MKLLRDLIKKYDDPLYKNSHYLMINSILASMLGFIFWIIIARRFSTHEVGLATALISISGILSIYSTVGLDISIIRYLADEKDKKRFINICMTIVTVTSLAISIIFILGINIWAPTLSYVNNNLIYIILFVIFTISSALFILMNNTFIALRDTKDLLIQNLFLNLIRIPLPFLLVFLLANFSIFASFSLSMVLTLIISLLIFLRRKIADYKPNFEFDMAVLKKVFHFSTVNYISTIFGNLPTLVIPLIIINFLQPAENAYYYIAFTIASVLFVVPVSFSSSLLAEGSYDDTNFYNNLKKAIKQTYIILIPAVIFTIIFGDKILLIFGKAYSSEGTTLLSLFAISAIFISLNSIYIVYLRIRMKKKELMILTPVSSSLTIIIAYVLIPKIGIMGTGIGYLVAQSLFSTYIILNMLKLEIKNRRSKVNLKDVS